MSSQIEPGQLADDVVRAAARIRPHVRETPLFDSPSLGVATGAEVLLKLEGLQRTGSFKLRGAMNRLLLLDAADRGRGVVAASSGNHGAAVAHAGRSLEIPVTVFVPQGASSTKVDAMRASGAEVCVFGTDGLDTEIEARRVASERDVPYISPYNDVGVIAGQGTVGVELRRQAGRIDGVICAVGGGGLIAGVAADLKAHLPHIRVIGALPANSPVMAASVRAGRVLEMTSRPTLSDGTAGGVEADAITFPLCQALVDEWVEVDEGEIVAGLRHCLTREHVLAEGAAAVTVAALWRTGSTFRGQRVAVVLCGSNISVERLCAALAGTA